MSSSLSVDNKVGSLYSKQISEFMKTNEEEDEESSSMSKSNERLGG